MVINIGIVLACGNSTRFGLKIPKQIFKLKNKFIVEYSINAMNKLHKIIVITNTQCFITQFMKH